MHHIFLQGPNKHHAAEGSNQVHWGQGFKPSPSGLFEILQNQLRIDKTDSKKILEKSVFHGKEMYAVGVCMQFRRAFANRTQSKDRLFIDPYIPVCLSSSIAQFV